MTKKMNLQVDSLKKDKTIDKQNRNLNTEMIVITTDNLLNDFQEFAKLKNKEGIVTEVVSTSTTGTTDVEIRNWLKTQKQNNSYLRYVILGGDGNMVPAHNFTWIKKEKTK